MPNLSDDRGSLRDARRNYGGGGGNKRYRRRRSIRLRDYDYSQPGAYFVTMVTQHRRCLFGRIVDGHNVLSPAGRLVERIWYELPIKFPTIRLDVMQIMPDHMHFVLFLLAPPGYRAAPDCLSAPALQIPFDPAASLRVNAIGRFDEWLEPRFWPSLATVVGWYKWVGISR